MATETSRPPQVVPSSALAKGMRLPSRPPETNAQAILLRAVPGATGSWTGEVGASLASITTEGGGNIRSSGGEVRSSKGLKSWKYISSTVANVQKALEKPDTELLSAIPEADVPAAQSRLAEVRASVKNASAAAEKKKGDLVVKNQYAALRAIDDLASLAALGKATPIAVPDDYVGVPRLFGHADVALTIGYKKPDGSPTEGQVVLEVDGFSAPISAARFVGLADQGTYDGLAFNLDDEVLLQTAKPKSDVEPIPMEVLVEGAKEAEYATTLEAAGLFNERPVLPFNAYGTVAFSHPDDLPNDGGAQFFFVKTDPTETPAGLNLLDGNYAVVGYVIDGQTILNELHAGDVIRSAKVIGGVYKFL